MSRHPGLTLRALKAIGVEVPMTYALSTRRATITRAPLLLIDLETEEGVTGHAYLFCYLLSARRRACDCENSRRSRAQR